MKLSAQQIRLMLKPMADFAPAVLRAAEIVEEAEAAEQRLAAAEGARTALENEINIIRGRKAGYEARDREYQRDLDAVIKAGEVKKAELEASIAPLRATVGEIQAEIRAAEKERAEVLERLNGEIKELEEKRRQAERDYEVFKAKFS